MALYADYHTDVRAYNDTADITADSTPLGDLGWYWQNMLYNSCFEVTGSTVTTDNSGLTTTGTTSWVLSSGGVLHVDSADGYLRFNSGGVGYDETAITYLPGSTSSALWSGGGVVYNQDIQAIDYYEGVTCKISIRSATAAANRSITVDGKWQSGTTSCKGAGVEINSWQPDFSSGAGYKTTSFTLPSDMSTTSNNFQICINYTGETVLDLQTVVVLVPRTPTLTGFTASKTSGKIGDTITFTPTQTYRTSSDWTYGDGGTGTSSTGTRTYNTRGTFDVSCTVYNGETSNNGWNNTPAGNSKGEATYTRTGYIIIDDIDLIFNIYGSEEDAIANTNNFTTDVDGTIDNGSQATNSYYVFEKLWYRIDSNEPVKKFYIDWDDGEDNSPEKANYSLIELDSPSFFGVTPHVYTSHKRFFPKVRAFSTDGYWSKYYTPYVNTAHVQTMTFVADTSDDYDGKYFIIYDGNDKPYAVWFDNDNSGTTAPYPTGEGLTSVEINPATGATGANIAGLVGTAIHALDGFSATPVDGSSATVTITNAIAGRGKDIDLATMNKGHALTAGTVVYTTTTLGSANDYSALDDRDLSTNQNTSSIVSVEKSGSPRLPIFEPANKPPEAILKIDRNEVFSGIDNAGLIRSGLSTGDTDTEEVRAYCTNSTKNSASEIKLLVTYKTNSEAAAGASAPYGDTEPNVIQKRILKVGTSTGSLDTSTTPPTCPALKNVDEILEVELLNLLEGTANSKLAGDERVYLKTENDFIICYVSLGNPLINNLKPGYNILMDGSESMTRASNVDIARYIFDDGKYFSSNGGITASDTAANTYPNTPTTTVYQNAGSSPALTYDSVTNTSSWTAPTLQVSDIFNITDTASNVDSSINSYAQQISPSKTVTYRHSHLEGDFLDSHGRFLDTYRLLRLQVRDDSYKDRYDTDGDKIEFSGIEHWDETKYSDSLIRPAHMKSKAYLGAHNDGLAGTPTWFTDVTSNNKNMNYVYNGLGTPDWTGSDEDGLIMNWCLAVQQRQFKGLFLRMANGPASSSSSGNTDAGNTGGVPYSPTYGSDFAKVRLQVWYSAPAGGNDTSGPSSAGSYVWKPLAYTDYTDYNGEEYSSLINSGALHWNIPEDWESVTASQLTWPSTNFAGSGGSSPTAKWTFPGYGILIGMAIKINPEGDAALDSANPNIFNILPFDNSHSQIIKIKDPHHISLSDINVSQNIGWQRKGKFVELKDRMGRAEWRKISAEGGKLKFGGVDLAGSTIRKTLTNYQKDNVPVYLTVERPNGEFIRFYGVIEQLAEDQPTGGRIPKWNISLATSYVQEFDASGNKLTDLIALGGDIGNEQKYVL